MRQQVEHWRVQQLSAEMIKLIIYRAFIEGELEVPKHLARRVRDHSEATQTACFSRPV
jgi:hypothetical protein